MDVVTEIRSVLDGKAAALVGRRVDREEPFMGGITVYMSKRLGDDPA